MWFIWKARNKNIFQMIEPDSSNILRHAVVEFSAWKDVQPTAQSNVEMDDVDY